MNDVEIALLVAGLGAVGVVVGAVIRVWAALQSIHVLVNSNLDRLRFDLRMVLAASFVTILITIVAVYKGMARLRLPPKRDS